MVIWISDVYRYWTDNGTCYYYTTDKFSNYKEALVAMKQQADKEGIPYRYLQVKIKIQLYGTDHEVVVLSQSRYLISS